MTPAPIEILLVEDNETDVFVIEEVLRHAGIPCRIHRALDGERALSLLGLAGAEASMLAGLVLLDLNIPRVPGLEVLRRMRTDPRYQTTPVVVVTSSNSRKDREAVQVLKGDAYFCKPGSLADFRALEEIVRAVLFRAKASGEAF